MVKKEQEDIKQGFALARENYKLLVIGFAIIVFGFILMVGGKSEDPNIFNPEIFSFRTNYPRSDGCSVWLSVRDLCYHEKAQIG